MSIRWRAKTGELICAAKRNWKKRGIEFGLVCIPILMIVMDAPVLLILVWMHFVADFVLQYDKMAHNKSSSNKWLSIHVAIYTAPFFWFGWQFALLNGAAHWITDYFTSRATTELYKREENHWFFVVIGFDQAIHLTCIFLLYQQFLT